MMVRSSPEIDPDRSSGHDTFMDQTCLTPKFGWSQGATIAIRGAKVGPYFRLAYHSRRIVLKQGYPQDCGPV